jgi:hypothetical protein
MSIKVAAFILVLATLMAILIAAPIIFLIRKSRRKNTDQPPTLATQSLNWKQALPGLVIVVALFFAYAAEYIAPESWLGLRVRTMEGKFWLFVLIWLVLYSIERIVRSFRAKNANGENSK